MQERRHLINAQQWTLPNGLTPQTPLRHSRRITFQSRKPNRSPATIAACSVLQLRQEIRQIKELSLRLNFPLLVELEEADAFQEEDLSGLGCKT